MAKKLVVFVALSLLAGLASVVPVSMPVDAQGGGVVCSWVDTGTDFDVTWDLYAGADKYVIYRTVDGAGPHWRGAVNDPGTSFTGDAYPNQGGTVIYEVAVKDASNTEIDRSTCTDNTGGGGGGVVCGYYDIPDGTHVVGLLNDVAGAVTYSVERSTTPGAWSAVGTVDPVTPEFFDAAAGGSPLYRIVALDGVGATVSTHDCDALTFDLGASDPLYALPTLPTGELGGTGSGATPTLLFNDSGPVPTTSNLPNTPVGAPPVCAGAGLYRALPRSGGDDSSVWATLSVPVGGEVIVDVSNRKDLIEGGNWSAAVRMYHRNPDGTAGAQTGNYGWATPYWWNQLEYRHPDVSLGTNNGPGTEFLIEMIHFTEISIGFAEKARYFVDNFRIVDADGDIIGRPCDADDIAECESVDGRVFFPEDTTIGGTTYARGCYAHDGCTADIPAAINAFGSPVHRALTSAAVYLCENDDVANGILIGSGIVLVIASGVVVIYTAPAAATFLTQQVARGATVTAFRAAASSEAGQVSTAFLVRAAIATGATAAALQFFDNPLNFDSSNDEVTVGTGDQLVTSIINQSVDIDTYLDNNTRLGDGPEERNQLENAYNHAIATCLEQLTQPFVQTIANQFLARNPGVQVQTDGMEIIVDGTRRHACSILPIYMPGAGTNATGSPITSATNHISHVLLDTPFIEYALADPQFYADFNPPVPRPEQFLLNRRDPAASRDWFAPGTAYSCKGEGQVTACDEFPAASTLQGGDPGPGTEGTATQPHLGIISWAHNSSQGPDQRSFYLTPACAVEDGDLFMVVPMPLAMIGLANTATGIVTDRLRSQFFCDGHDG